MGVQLIAQGANDEKNNTQASLGRSANQQTRTQHRHREHAGRLESGGSVLPNAGAGGQQNQISKGVGMNNKDYLGPPSSPGWWWLCDGGTTDEVPPWYMAYWDGKTLRVYTPTDSQREWSWEWDGEDWVYCGDQGYSEVDPIQWIPADRVDAVSLREAILELLALVEDDRRVMVECNSEIELIDGKCSPVPGTLEPDVAEHVARYDAAELGKKFRSING
jgi:hypothetical protein